MFKKKQHDAPDQPDEPDELEARGASAPTSPESAESSADSSCGEPAESELERLIRERDENLRGWQRAQADYQNLRRRLQADIDAAVQRSKQPLLEELLLAIDYLDMALSTTCTTPEVKSLLSGVELTKSQLLRALERENVRAVPETGRFDSAVHQAVEPVETDEREPGEVIQTLRRGYTVNGVVLRPAQVRVAVEPSSKTREAVKTREADGTREADPDSDAHGPGLATRRAEDATAEPS